VPKVKTVPEDKTTNPTANVAAPATSSDASAGEKDFYNKLVQRHRSLVEDYSRIEAKIRLLESQLEKVLAPN
jgi:hypothetical protein